MTTPDMAITMARIRRENLRWYLLVALNVSRPAGCGTVVLLSVMQANYPDATEQEVRRELDYLLDRKLIEIDKKPDGRWHCELNRLGVDLVEYTIDCEPGIARPRLG
jgi:hypothetical protein